MALNRIALGIEIFIFFFVSFTYIFSCIIFIYYFFMDQFSGIDCCIAVVGKEKIKKTENSVTIAS